MSPSAEAILQTLIFVLFLAVALFVSAGTLDLPAFWLYLVIFAAVCVIALAVVDPELAQERMRPGGQRPEAKYLFVVLWPLAHWTIAGLDRGRFHWSDTVPAWLWFAAVVLFAAGWIPVVWAMRENRFASSAVRIQTERGHHVITTGPYAVIRHPMYLAGLVVIVASGLVLGSWLATAIALAGVPLLLWQAIAEDRFLIANLPGYREYAERVRARIIPGVW